MAVQVGKVLQKPMSVKIQVVGNVEAASTVDIRSQVTGELLKVHFEEGDDVTAGQLLFTLDSRPFEVTLKQTEAALTRDKAQLVNAELQMNRSADLLKRGLQAQSAHDALVAQAEALRGTVASDTAIVDNARLQLQYTRITAPVAGRTGALLAHQGSLVRPNDASPLVRINQVSPIDVSFAVPARLMPELANDRTRRALKVTAAPSGAKTGAVSGTVTFMDNTVDRATDTITLKASFANRDRKLWPGAFVDVALQLSVDPNALVVPNAAVQPSQQGQFVYVVQDDQSVQVRAVQVGWIEGDESVVLGGLKAGETVVTDGQLRLTPGARVTTRAPSEGGRGEGMGRAAADGRSSGEARGGRAGREGRQGQVP